MNNNTSSSSSRSRFRFRDQPQESQERGSPEDDVISSDSSSVSSDGEFEPELTSMTGKGIYRLCLELLELKKASEEDFQKNIFSNYSSFVRIFKEMEDIKTQLTKLKNHASTQQMLVSNFKEEIYLQITFEDMVEPIIEEPLHVESSTTSMLETHTENVSDILDTLLSENRLDEALEILEVEGDTFQNMQFQESIPLEIWKSCESVMSDRRAMLVDQYTFLAGNPRVCAAELQKALVGLCRLGENNVATQLLLKYYHLRIACGMHDFQSSEAYSHGLYIREVAKFIFSKISQAARSFIRLHGGTSYSPELIQWAYDETKLLATLFTEYVKSISDISGGLSTAVEAMNFAMSYCSLLDIQRLQLQPCLIEHIRPCMEEVLQIHFDHLEKLVFIFTSTDTWVLGKYLLPEILSHHSSSVVTGQEPEYSLLTNSGRKFVTVLQAIKEDISSLVLLQMESPILRRLEDLFTEYTSILERSLSNKDGTTWKGGFKINLAESLVQQVSVVTNLSTLVKVFPCIIRNIFKESIHLEFEIEMESYTLFIQEAISRLQANICEQFIHKAMSPEEGHGSTQFGFIWKQDDSDTTNVMPSNPYLVLFSELRKLEKLAEEDLIEEWLMDRLRELVEAAFIWVSRNEEMFTMLKEDFTDQHSTNFMQFVLDIHFLLEIARSGGYLTNFMVNSSYDIISRLESAFVSVDSDHKRVANDYDWAKAAATKALQKLQEVEISNFYPDGSIENSLEDDDESIGNLADSVESLDDSVSIDALEVSANTETMISNGGQEDFSDDSSLDKNAQQNAVSSEANTSSIEGFVDKSAMKTIAVLEESIGAKSEISTTQAIISEPLIEFEGSSFNDLNTMVTAATHLKLKQNEAMDEEESESQKLQKTKSWDMLLFSDDEISSKGELEEDTLGAGGDSRKDNSQGLGMLFSDDDDVNEASNAWFSEQEGTTSQHYCAAEPVIYNLGEGVHATLLDAFTESEHLEQTKDPFSMI